MKKANQNHGWFKSSTTDEQLAQLANQAQIIPVQDVVLYLLKEKCPSDTAEAVSQLMEQNWVFADKVKTIEKKIKDYGIKTSKEYAELQVKKSDLFLQVFSSSLPIEDVPTDPVRPVFVGAGEDAMVNA